MEATNDGLGWQRIDGVTFDFQVNRVEAWSIFMTLWYERCSNKVLKGVVYFKLGIDSRCQLVLWWSRMLLFQLLDFYYKICLSLLSYD